jgi:hypothetical protein
MTILNVWLYCGLLIMAGYILPALLIDRRLAFGTWTWTGLGLFMLLGPLGVILEVFLLVAVFRDVIAHMQSAGSLCSSVARTRDLLPE